MGLLAIIGHELKRQAPLVEQELLTLPEHLSSTPVIVVLVLLDL